DGCSYIIRKVTGEEKNSLLRLTMAFVYRELRCSARLVWLGIIKYSYNKHGYNDAGEYLNVGIEGACGIRLRYSDSVAILRTRRRFSSKIVSVICDKFSGMLENKYKFNDGTTIDRVAWFRVSRKLFPIAKGEVKHIIADERVELEEIVSGSRAVVDRTTDREITDGEKFIVLESIMKLVCNALKSLCAKVWESVIESLRGNFDDEVSNIEDVSAELSSVGNLSSSSVNFPLDAEICGASGLLGLSLCHEDDIAILNIRRKFSSCVRIRVRNKFSKMLKEKYEFEDHTIIDMSPWIRLSKKLIPIAKKEIEPIIEEQYIKIKEVLLKSRVIVSSKGYSCTTRELTSEERSSIIKIIMKSVHKQSMDAFSRVWRAVIESLGGGRYSTVGTDSVVNEANALELEADGFVKDNLLSVSLSNLREEDMAELDNVRLEFVGNLASIVDEVVNLLLSDVDMSLSIAVNVLDKVISTTAERSSVLFKEGGFHERVESVLLNAMVLEPSGNARVLEADERKYIFQIFMDSIDSDRDYLARKRAGELIGASVSALGDEHVGLLAS
uniref:hypothetical protein n=1 Tax=Candidatus Ichthyocystis hellenicum TaxID=1561003 RepID=UPI0015844A3C